LIITPLQNSATVGEETFARFKNNCLYTTVSDDGTQPTFEAQSLGTEINPKHNYSTNNLAVYKIIAKIQTEKNYKNLLVQ